MQKRAESGATGEALDPAAAPWWLGVVRQKHNIDPTTLTILGVVACLPIVLVLCRLLALPGGGSLALPGTGLLRVLGETLNQSFTLDWVPASDRPAILYLLLLPTGAVLITLARLTLGVRVLGLRAILLAIAIQSRGLIPSMLLLAIVIGLIIVFRRWARQIKLPLYARIGIIVCIASLVMVSALLIAPWLRSEAIWSVGFFPVVIMAMFAEGIAKTIEQDNSVTAAWRGAWTIALALLIALIDGATSRFVFQFPELIITQLVAIVFIAEFMDARLLEEWPARLSRWVEGTRPWFNANPRIAVVRNRDTSGVIGRLGRLAPDRYAKMSIQRQVDALRELGFDVRVFEGDVTLFRELSRYIPADHRRGGPGGIAFNLATGVQGKGRFAQVPAMLELAGIPYTGPGPTTHGKLSDRAVLLSLLEQASLAVPRSEVIDDPSDGTKLDFPMHVSARFEPDAKPAIVRSARALRRAVERNRVRFGQPSVAEEMVAGRRVRVALLGNDSLECLPLVEYSPKGGGHLCPAPLEEELAEQVREAARTAFVALGCRDYARIDIRVPQFGAPVVVDVKWFDLLSVQGSFVRAAEAAGYTLPGLLRRIIDEAAKRYVTEAAPQKSRRRKQRQLREKSTVVSLADRRSAAK